MVILLGCLLIGIAICRIARDTLWWHFATTGLLGGFTTMSGLAVETEGLLDAGRVGAASSYVAASLLVGFAALLLGERIGSSGQRRNSAISMERER